MDTNKHHCQEIPDFHQFLSKTNPQHPLASHHQFWQRMDQWRTRPEGEDGIGHTQRRSISSPSPVRSGIHRVREKTRKTKEHMEKRPDDKQTNLTWKDLERTVQVRGRTVGLRPTRDARINEQTNKSFCW